MKFALVPLLIASSYFLFLFLKARLYSPKTYNQYVSNEEFHEAAKATTKSALE